MRFTAAVHTLLCISFFGEGKRVTSQFISGSTGVNAVIIRKILLQLQKANLVETRAGVGGSRLAKPAGEITLRDVYRAVNSGEDERNLFSFHQNPNEECPVGSKIHAVLDSVLESAEGAMEAELSMTTIDDLQKKLS